MVPARLLCWVPPPHGRLQEDQAVQEEKPEEFPGSTSRRSSAGMRLVEGCMAVVGVRAEAGRLETVGGRGGAVRMLVRQLSGQ